MKLVETWVKAPILKNASLLLVGECTQIVYPTLFKKFSEEKVVLSSCPEVEPSIHGKLASIIRCSTPRDITVLTIDGSPYCFTLHAAVNEACFVTNSVVPAKHFVIVNGRVVEISPESIRIGRYLSLTQKCLLKHPELVQELSELSLEHKWYKRMVAEYCRKKKK